MLTGVVLAALLTSCAVATPPRTAAVTASGSAEPDLASQRRAAGVPDCEVPRERAQPVAGGLPDLVLRCLGSDRELNLSQLRGRPLVINLWAQWCEPCRAESGYLRAFASRAGEQIRIIGVNYDDPKPDWAIEFAGLVGWRYEQLADPERRLGSRLLVPGIPLTLFVTPDGRIVHSQTGPVASTDELTALVKQYLGVTV